MNPGGVFASSADDDAHVLGTFSSLAAVHELEALFCEGEDGVVGVQQFAMKQLMAAQRRLFIIGKHLHQPGESFRRGSLEPPELLLSPPTTQLQAWEETKASRLITRQLEGEGKGPRHLGGPMVSGAFPQHQFLPPLSGPAVWMGPPLHPPHAGHSVFFGPHGGHPFQFQLDSPRPYPQPPLNTGHLSVQVVGNPRGNDVVTQIERPAFMAPSLHAEVAPQPETVTTPPRARVDIEAPDVEVGINPVLDALHRIHSSVGYKRARHRFALARQHQQASLEARLNGCGGGSEADPASSFALVPVKNTPGYAAWKRQIQVESMKVQLQGLHRQDHAWHRVDVITSHVLPEESLVDSAKAGW